MLLFYIRHGDPIYNPDSLTPLGQKQAEALAKRLAVYGIDEIYSSSSVRAQQTAKPTCELLKKDVHLLDWCQENLAWEEFTVKSSDGDWNTWAFADREYRKLFASPKIVSLGDKWYDAEELNGCRFKQGIERIEKETYSFLEALGYRYDKQTKTYTATAKNDKRIALFAHEGFGKAFLPTVLGIPYPMFCVRFGLGHSSMTVIEFRGETDIVPEILTLSNDSHLYKEGVPIFYQNGAKF